MHGFSWYRVSKQNIDIRPYTWKEYAYFFVQSYCTVLNTTTVRPLEDLLGWN